MRKHLLLMALASTGLAAANPAHAKIISAPVVYPVGTVTMKGYLAYDDEKTRGKRVPGVLVVGEWWGLNDYVKSRADQLAAMGYVAFVADMYGQGIVTEDPQKAKVLAGELYGNPLMVDRARAALDQLAGNDRVAPAKLAAIGFCFGGSVCQVLAYNDPRLLGIVSFHGNPMPAPAAVKGKVKTRFLLLNGGADPNVPPEAKAALEKSLREAQIDFQSIDYPGALHAFTNPDATRLAEKIGMVGRIGYNEPAARESWQKMQQFFGEIFGTSAPPAK